MQENQQPTTQDILEAINDFAGQVEKRFEGIDRHFEGIDGKLSDIQKEIKRIDTSLFGILQEMESLRHAVERVEKTAMEDTTALASEVIKLKERVNLLEQQIVQRRLVQG